MFCLTNDEFIKTPHSYKALSSIIAARKACKLNPFWNPIFEKLTGIKF